VVETIYIEQNIVDHPRTQSICARFAGARQIICDRYTEVFNPKSQNFRLQKAQPSLILAKKHNNLVLKTPPGYGLGATENYYFSHMLNCLYDCRYCFLQGMYNSANYVVFVNFEDFAENITSLSQATPDKEIHFFSGYDCDSLAFDPVTQFANCFLDTFQNLSNAWLELRTKSTQIRSLLSRPVIKNCIVAYSFTPAEVSTALEHKVPAYKRRLEALRKLSDQGWNIGLRFDPLIYQENYQDQYRRLFRDVFADIDVSRIHSVSFGNFRLPKKFFGKITRLYPDEKLFAGPLKSSKGLVSYNTSLESEMMEFCSRELLNYIPKTALFPCTN